MQYRLREIDWDRLASMGQRLGGGFQSAAEMNRTILVPFMSVLMLSCVTAQPESGFPAADQFIRHVQHAGLPLRDLRKWEGLRRIPQNEYESLDRTVESAYREFQLSPECEALAFPSRRENNSVSYDAISVSCDTPSYQIATSSLRFWLQGFSRSPSREDFTEGVVATRNTGGTEITASARVVQLSDGFAAAIRFTAGQPKDSP